MKRFLQEESHEHGIDFDLEEDVFDVLFNDEPIRDEIERQLEYDCLHTAID